ncbi:MAG: glycosyltransferase involved in cell wall biosynthesis [Minisyncoccia bacterium]|jgi:glycosyltransferase involved in cell wall biosynthesis
MIVFDIQAVQSIEHGERGIARYTGELARALQASHPDLVDVFAYNDALPYVPRLDALGLEGKLRSFSELRGQRVDLLHVNSPFEQPSIGVLAAPVIAERTVVTCYDLIPYRFSDIYLPDAGAKAWYQSRLGMLVSSDAIVTDSQSAADDVVRMLDVDARVVTSIGAGTAEQFAPPTDTLADRMLELNKVVPALLPGFVMVPAGPEWRKNLEGAVDAYSRLDPKLRERHQLLIASKIAEGQRATFFNYCQERGVADDVVVTGFVSDPDLVRLYQSAELVLFPSRYEGFGLPVLEARRCGARVITSNVSSLPEVMPEPAALFNPHDTDDIAAKLLAALTDVDVIAALDRAADPGFTWERAAHTLADVYAEVIGRPLLPSGHTRSHIALAAPLPLHEPELANRTLALVAQLEAETQSDVTIFVQDDASRLAEDRGRNVQNLRILPARHAAGEYDAVLCVLGDKAIEDAFAAIARIVPAQLAVWPDDGEHSQQAQALVDLLGPTVEVGQLAAAIARRTPIGG